MIEPVPYEKVQGVGFYRQFLSTRDWPGFMEAGRIQARQALAATETQLASANTSSKPATITS